MGKIKKPKKVKCRYKHCLHEDSYLNKEDAIMGGGKYYYHPDCYKEKEKIKDAIEYCISITQNCNTEKRLKDVIEDIVYDKKVSIDELLYKIDKSINTGWKIYYPKSLYAIIDNDTIDKCYRSYINRQLIDLDYKEAELVEDTKFNYVCPKKKTIIDILV